MWRSCEPVTRHAYSCPLPLRERATPTFQQALTGEGYGPAPSPSLRCRTAELPSPARGEGMPFIQCDPSWPVEAYAFGARNAVSTKSIICSWVALGLS
jgi:hypothetical protein